MEKQTQTEQETGFKLNWTNKEKAIKDLEVEKMFKELNIEVFE